MNGQATAPEAPEAGEWTTAEEVAAIPADAARDMERYQKMMAETSEFRAQRVTLLFRKARAAVEALTKWGEEVRLVNLNNAPANELKELLAWTAGALKLKGEAVEISYGKETPAQGVTGLVISDLRLMGDEPEPPVTTEDSGNPKKTVGARTLQNAFCKLCNATGHDRRSHINHPAKFTAAELAKKARETGVPQVRL